MALSSALLLSVVATLCNPYGWGIYRYAGVLTARAVGRHIEEWLPPSPLQGMGAVFFLSLLLLPLLYWRARRQPTALEWCLALCFVPLACRSVRMVVWWLLVCTPLLACTLNAARNPAIAREYLPSGSRVARTLAATFLLALLGTAATFSVPWMEGRNPLFGTLRSPHRTEDDLQAAAGQIRAGGGGRVFSRLEWGEYLAWAGHGSSRVFIDGRIENYPDGVWAQYLVLSGGRPAWRQILTDYQVDYLLLDAQYHASLLEQVKRSPPWKLSYQSGQAVLFERREAAATAR